ncbi:MAG: hypothetical protein VB060_01950 [Oscillibacter sp.]|nr:hypothetical protein [Oscillibacter sp.]MEA4992585.1 hypothetical protein [Oscillibacter sp.]MEA5039622.1 hypothetical protein [Clostridiaceae bacterium]
MKQIRPFLSLLWYLPTLIPSGGYVILYWMKYSDVLVTQYNPTYAMIYKFHALPLLICSAVGLIVGTSFLLSRTTLPPKLRRWSLAVSLTVLVLYFPYVYFGWTNFACWPVPAWLFPMSVRMLVLRLSEQWFFFALMGALFAFGVQGKGRPRNTAE